VIRAGFYAALLLFFIGAAYQRARLAEKALDAEVVSIAGEWEKHGKPAAVRAVDQGPLYETIKVSGIMGEDGLIRGDVVPETARVLAASSVFDGCGESAVSGSVLRVAKEPDLATGMHPVVLDAVKGRLARGSIAVACVRRITVPWVLRVPAAAVSGGTERVVWVAQGSKAARRTVELGRADESFFEVLKGLSAGELAVVRGWRELEPGDALRIVEAPR